MKTFIGFSLVEMLVGIAILVLILVLIPPMFPNVIASMQLKSSVHTLASGLKQTRSEAIHKQTETALTLDVEKMRFIAGNKQHSINLPQDTQISLIAADTEQLSARQAAIRFFPDGSSTGGRIAITNPRAAYVIDVNWLTGKIRVSTGRE